MTSLTSTARARYRVQRLMEHMTPSHTQPTSPLPHPSSSSSSSSSSSTPSPLPSLPLPSASPSPTSSASPSSPLPLSDSLYLRRLHVSDFHKHYLSLLSQLTDVGDISESRFTQRFEEVQARGDSQQVWVIEDVAQQRVVASATLLVELKFIHNISKIAHIEDVVVNGEYRGKNLGYRLIDHLQSVARELGCYKVILCCEDKNIGFYAKLGFKPHANHLANYFQPLGGGARKNSN